ncbi:adenosine deaminase-related growth [Rickenella mellea]|uniref:adenosine deaminase n=1 Tax=Rickenella mellea TaxID=50990 RepID=A0A4Y7QDS4_9AGAM|nr:adenosine deaminase-related growth [Rickenella mellea]
MDKYLSARSALITEERKSRRDTIRIANASEEELQAEQIVRNLRKSETASIWSTEHEGIGNVFPGMEFLTARAVITKTRLFQLLCKMPKGALLHSHLDAMVNANYLINLALEQPAMHVRVNTRLTEESLGSVHPEFRPLTPHEYTNIKSLTSDKYELGAWVPIRSARAHFATSLGGPEGFDQWVFNALTINPTEAYVTHNTVKKIWNKFRTTFMVSTPLIRFVPIWSNYIREFFRTLIEDGVSYVEPRVNFWHKFMVGEDGEENVPHRQWIILFGQVLDEIKTQMKTQGKTDEFIGARIIYSTIRNVTCEELEWYLEDCISLKLEFPHLIAGFDLVGDENVLQPLIYYIRPLLRFQERQKELGIDIPFIFHAGETLGDGDAPDMNLFDAILLGSKRIGHGFSLAKHPKLIEICKERGVTVEVCPISNEILRLSSSMPAHPLPVLLNNGVPVALCSDDPSVFGNMGLSYDFFQVSFDFYVLVASEVTGLITLGDIARQSIESSTLDETEKAQALFSWGRKWDAFVKSIADGSTGIEREIASTDGFPII